MQIKLLILGIGIGVLKDEYFISVLGDCQPF